MSKIVVSEISSSHSEATYIRTIGLSCAIWPKYTKRQTVDRQSDRKRRWPNNLNFISDWVPLSVVVKTLDSNSGKLGSIPGAQDQALFESCLPSQAAR